jgi:hypothetical protein
LPNVSFIGQFDGLKIGCSIPHAVTDNSSLAIEMQLASSKTRARHKPPSNARLGLLYMKVTSLRGHQTQWSDLIARQEILRSFDIKLLTA